MRHKARRWDHVAEDDPLAGLVNLFDLWMVFSIALLLALVTASRLPERLSNASTDAADAKSDAPPSTQQTKLEQFRVSHEKLKGEGHRLGTAYRLKSGEVVYVPD